MDKATYRPFYGFAITFFLLFAKLLFYFSPMLKDLAKTKQLGYLDFDKCVLTLSEEDRESVKSSEIFQNFKHGEAVLLSILGLLALNYSVITISSRISEQFQISLSGAQLKFYIKAFCTFDPFKTIIADFREKLEESARFIPVASKAYRLERIQQEIDSIDEIEDQSARIQALNTLLKLARDEEKNKNEDGPSRIQNYYTFVQNVDAEVRAERGLAERAY